MDDMLHARSPSTAVFGEPWPDTYQDQYGGADEDGRRQPVSISEVILAAPRAAGKGVDVDVGEFDQCCVIVVID
ncbi:hypothetical protein [Candidatus Frankia alpina]|uniref:hypothetical protein n=1 Tax=Candidatus Frankia alpina TaxID=2699483 RepID=UPI0013D791FB|nr:hypothetical protein [Candidatus Frankia alpina]